MISFLGQDSNLNSIINLSKISNLFRQVCKNETDNNDTATSFYRDNDIIFAWVVDSTGIVQRDAFLKINERIVSIEAEMRTYMKRYVNVMPLKTIKTRLECLNYILHLI